MSEAASRAGPFTNSSDETDATAPVTCSRRCVPYPTTTTSRSATARVCRLKSATAGVPGVTLTVNSCVTYPMDAA
jgi:hypothetical protein